MKTQKELLFNVLNNDIELLKQYKLEFNEGRCLAVISCLFILHFITLEEYNEMSDEVKEIRKE